MPTWWMSGTLSTENPMGTNYYLRENVCEACDRFDELHIGKSSAGWCFTLHVDSELGINDLPDWAERWSKSNCRIRDEYGKTLSQEDMLLVITARHWDNTKKWWTGYADEADFHRQNHSENGPNGLLRHRLGQYCLKHGEGTWDCVPGEFS